MAVAFLLLSKEEKRLRDSRSALKKDHPRGKGEKGLESLVGGEEKQRKSTSPWMKS